MGKMKLVFTDEHQNKRVLLESDCLQEILDAVDADAQSKFIFIKQLKLVSPNPERYVFVDAADKETGYSVEE